MRHSTAFLVCMVWDLSTGEKNYCGHEVREAYSKNKTGRVICSFFIYSYLDNGISSSQLPVIHTQNSSL